MPDDNFEEKKEKIMNDFDLIIELQDRQQLISKLPGVIFLQLLTETPTQKSNDYRTLLLNKPKEDADENNYYYRGKLYFNNKKRNDVIPVPKHIKDQIDLLRRLDKQQKYLIQRNDRRPYTAPMLSKYVVRQYGKTIEGFRKL